MSNTNQEGREDIMDVEKIVGTAQICFGGVAHAIDKMTRIKRLRFISPLRGGAWSIRARASGDSTPRHAPRRGDPDLSIG